MKKLLIIMSLVLFGNLTASQTQTTGTRIPSLCAIVLCLPCNIACCVLQAVCCGCTITRTSQNTDTTAQPQ